MSAAEKRYGWRVLRLPPLAGSKEARQILGVDKMTLHRWMLDNSGGPGETGAVSSNTVYLKDGKVREDVYVPPWIETANGPIWVVEDLLRHSEEFGRKRPLAGQPRRSPV